MTERDELHAVFDDVLRGHRRDKQKKANGLTEPTPEWEAQHPANDPGDQDQDILPQSQWRVVSAAEWHNQIIPPQGWVWQDWLPRGQVTGLYGLPGVRKTTLLVQGMMAKSSHLPFCGHILGPPEPTLGLFCEDTEEAIIRIAAAIATQYGKSLADFPDFRFVSLVGHRCTELITFDGPKLLVLPPMTRLIRAIRLMRPCWVTLDTGPDFFGGNESARREVTQFIRTLDSIGIAYDCGIVFTAHPSQRGKATGTLDSGSTAWEAKVRGRLTLHDPGAEEEVDEEDRRRKYLPPVATDRRILTRQKSNYAKPGETIELVWRDGFFTPAAFDPVQSAERGKRGPARDAACDAQFLELLPKATLALGGVHTSANAPDRYAPAVFAKRKDAGDYGKAEFKRAMDRLLGSDRIRLVPFGSRKNRLEAVPSEMP